MSAPTGHAGTRWGVPFPVLARASFGVLGAHVPALLRALVACGWFGIQTWIGGSAIHQLLSALAGRELGGADLPLLGINFAEALCFLAFWGLQVAILWRGMESIKVLENLAAPFLIVMGLWLLAWAYLAADGFGPLFSAPSQFAPGGPREGQFWRVFFPGLTSMVGFWAALSLNIPDFTRYAKSQRDQVLGQPLFMMLFSFIGVAVTSATVVIYGEAIPDPVVLLGRMGGGMTVVVALLALSLATLYEYRRGVNPRALLALALGVAPNVPGFLAAAGFVEGVADFWTTLYTYAWFVGFGISGALYWLLGSRSRQKISRIQEKS